MSNANDNPEDRRPNPWTNFSYNDYKGKTPQTINGYSIHCTHNHDLPAKSGAQGEARPGVPEWANPLIDLIRELESQPCTGTLTIFTRADTGEVTLLQHRKDAYNFRGERKTITESVYFDTEDRLSKWSGSVPISKDGTPLWEGAKYQNVGVGYKHFLKLADREFRDPLLEKDPRIQKSLDALLELLIAEEIEHATPGRVS